MNEFQATVVMLGLFVLRCVVPLALMAVIAYGMNRLAERWEAEDAALRETRASAPPAPRQAPNIPCWVFNNCDEATRAACPAYRNRTLACWLVRLGADGKLPTKCNDCPLYTGAPAGTRIGFSGD